MSKKIQRKNLKMIFPKDLSTEQEEMLIQAFQNVVLEQTRKAIRNIIKKADPNMTKHFISVDVFRSKLETIALRLDTYMNLDKENDHTYIFWYNEDAMAMYSMEVFGKTMRTGKLVPIRAIKAHFSKKVFPHMGFKTGVKMESYHAEV